MRFIQRLSFLLTFLPDAEEVLHTEAYGGNTDPADEPHEDRLSACPDQLYDMGIEADGRHCHDNEKLTEFLERAGDERRKIEYRCDDRGKDKEQDEPGKYFFKAECGTGRRVQLFFFARTHEGQYQGDWNDREGAREFHDCRLVKRCLLYTSRCV